MYETLVKFDAPDLAYRVASHERAPSRQALSKQCGCNPIFRIFQHRFADYSGAFRDHHLG